MAEPRVSARTLSFALPLLLTGCDGPQSALAPAGIDAQRIADLFGWLFAGAAVIWLLVVGLSVRAITGHGQRFSPRAANLLIVGGGVVLPTVVLAGLLAYGLHLLADLRAPRDGAALRITVSGEQWWWRIRYQSPAGEWVELANEIRLPVGRPARFRLTSPDVIHSFWIPSLGGKMDMIPGRETWLVLEPTRTGEFRGACAEYCGTSHALMALPVVVMQPDAFDTWLVGQSALAGKPADDLAREGQRLFLSHGCGACHTVRGTPADGEVGPDLTHVGSRLTLAAGILPNDPEAFLRWLSHADRIKPGVHMPTFDMVAPDDLRAIAHYLEGLQ